jgi:XTP/dITP diphosphohydrolase
MSAGHRKLTEKKLVLASHNQGKFREFEGLFAGFDVELVSAGALGLAEPDETGTTFQANAILKARAAAEAAGIVALADDSGLAVAALGGAPGIYSARWAGGSRDFAAAMQRVENELQALGATTPEKRRASFVAGLSLVWPDGHDEYVEGRVEGTLVWPPRGERGFGYDPMFLPDGHTLTFGEMTAEEKHGYAPGAPGLSHRARAFALLVEACIDGAG